MVNGAVIAAIFSGSCFFSTTTGGVYTTSVFFSGGVVCLTGVFISCG